MKIATILGTRPEIIRLSRIIPKLDQLCEKHILIHTGQNYHAKLNDIFFDELAVRKPNHYLGARGTFGQQMATILPKLEAILTVDRPDKFLVLGDTNSSMGAMVAKRMGIPVYHMEAGNRCFDERVPEEVNRQIIDHCSTMLMPYTERSRQNLIQEGIPSQNIYVTGNPIFEVLQTYKKQIDESTIINEMGLGNQSYILATIHRTENVDNAHSLKILLDSLTQIRQQYKYPIVISTHPHTKLRLNELGCKESNNDIRFMEPFGFFDFVHLEKHAVCVITDSGTVQEECAILNVPNITVRNTTERPETIEYGSNIVSGIDKLQIVNGLGVALKNKTWGQIPEYNRANVSQTVINVLFSTY